MRFLFRALARAPVQQSCKLVCISKGRPFAAAVQRFHQTGELMRVFKINTVDPDDEAVCCR